MPVASSGGAITAQQAVSAMAAQYETRARDLGYTPPTSLDNQRK